MLGRDGRVQLWNSAAERLSGRELRSPTCSAKSSRWRGRSSRAPRWAPRSPARWPIAPWARPPLGAPRRRGRRARARRPDLPVRRRHHAVFFTDQTDLTRRTEDLSRTASLLGATLESTADGILAADGMGHMTLFNRRFVELWRIPKDIAESRDDARWRTWYASSATPTRSPQGAGALFVARGGELRRAGVHDGRCSSATRYPQRMDGGSAGRVWSFRDVTQRKAAERQLLHDAFHDALDVPAQPLPVHGAARRSIGRARLDEQYSFADALPRPRPLQGRERLARPRRRRSAARRGGAAARAVVRPGDTVARLGGDEFTVLIDNTATVERCDAVAERIMIELGARSICRGRTSS